MAAITKIIENPMVESIYVDTNGKTHTKYYSKEDLEKSEKEIQIIRKTTPAIRQGYLDGEHWSVDGDMKIDNLMLTAIVEFTNNGGYTFTCRYLLHKYMTGTYPFKHPKCIRRGTIIKIERKSTEELNEERIVGKFSSHKYIDEAIVKE